VLRLSFLGQQHPPDRSIYYRQVRRMISPTSSDSSRGRKASLDGVVLQGQRTLRDLSLWVSHICSFGIGTLDELSWLLLKRQSETSELIYVKAGFSRYLNLSSPPSELRTSYTLHRNQGVTAYAYPLLNLSSFTTCLRTAPSIIAYGIRTDVG